MDSKKPLISVITATYNRSNVLFYAISSVVKQTYPNWELIVVGDACTDDTEEVVRSFNDPRIRFFNLEENFGDQGGPNNEGFRYAQGQFIAYLNHDDLWLPEHLDIALSEIMKKNADMVFPMGLAIRTGGQNSLLGVQPDEHFYPDFVPASLWFMKRELLEEVGPWRHPQECYLMPSWDLLIRAWRAGKVIRAIPHITVVAVQAGYRPDIYATKEYGDNRLYFERIQKESDFLEKELLAITRSMILSNTELKVWPYLRRKTGNVLRIVGKKLGIVPYEMMFKLHYRKKGGFINKWRKSVGLPKLK